MIKNAGGEALFFKQMSPKSHAILLNDRHNIAMIASGGCGEWIKRANIKDEPSAGIGSSALLGILLIWVERGKFAKG